MKRTNNKGFSCQIEKKILEQVKINALDYNYKDTSSYINDCIKYALKNMRIEE